MSLTPSVMPAGRQCKAGNRRKRRPQGLKKTELFPQNGGSPAAFHNDSLAWGEAEQSLHFGPFVRNGKTPAQGLAFLEPAWQAREMPRNRSELAAGERECDRLRLLTFWRFASLENVGFFNLLLAAEGRKLFQLRNGPYLHVSPGDSGVQGPDDQAITIPPAVTTASIAMSWGSRGRVAAGGRSWQSKQAPMRKGRWGEGAFEVERRALPLRFPDLPVFPGP